MRRVRAQGALPEGSFYSSVQLQVIHILIDPRLAGVSADLLVSSGQESVEEGEN